VRRVLVHEGDHVKSGDLLVQLDDADARAQAAKAQAQLRAAEADLHAVRSGGTREEVLTGESQLAKAQAEVQTAQRNLAALERLQQRGAASAGEVEAAQTRLTSAQADLKLAQQKQSSRYSNPEVERVQAQSSEARASLAAAEALLRHSDVRAPHDGVVYSLPVRPGQFVNTGDLLAQVADLTVVQVRGYIDEPDIGRLGNGQQVQVSWDAIPGRIWEGALTRVPSTVVMVGSRNVGEITCRVNNSDLRLLPNINVSVNVITAKAQNVVVAPREAVHQEDGQRFVYQVVEGKLQRRNVQTAIANLTQIEIQQGLANDMQVAVGAINGQPLRDGMPVTIIGQ
jgi:HlyD family secretion protein